MADLSLSKISLVAEFDDLCRYTNSLLEAGCEEQFEIFVENQWINHFKYKESEVKFQKLNNNISHLKGDNKRLEVQNKYIKKIYEDEMKKTKQVEAEKQAALRQIDLIKELLSEDNCAVDNKTKEKLSFLSLSSVSKHSVNSPPPFEGTKQMAETLWYSMDDIKEDLDCPLQHGQPRKWSSSETRLSLKKKKYNHTAASPTSSMIPSQIVHCVTEIEKRGFNEAGLYRVPGSAREVKDLKQLFGKGIPSLHQYNVHALCSLVKEFLHSLRELLITPQAWQSFVDVANLKDYVSRQNMMYEQVENLPQFSRDTLAFLILHFQKVAQSPACKMPVSNLAIVLGPAIAGYSKPDLDPVDVLKETEDQVKVMECLLLIPSEAWKIFLNLDDVGNVKTPECLPGTPSTVDEEK